MFELICLPVLERKFCGAHVVYLCIVYHVRCKWVMLMAKMQAFV